MIPLIPALRASHSYPSVHTTIGTGGGYPSMVYMYIPGIRDVYENLLEQKKLAAENAGGISTATLLFASEILQH